MALPGVRVVHAIPGRIRLKLRQIRGNAELAWEVEEQLSRIPGVANVEANAVTGSVLVVFAEHHATPALSLEHLATRWPSTLGTLDVAALEHERLHGSNGSSSHPHPALDRRIVSIFGSLNAGVSQATSGGDLKVLVPLALFFLGVRGLFSEKMPFPAWYDFFWFALSTFVMLNRAAIEAPAEAVPASLS